MALTPLELMQHLFPTPIEQTVEERLGWGAVRLELAEAN